MVVSLEVTSLLKWCHFSIQVTVTPWSDKQMLNLEKVTLPFIIAVLEYFFKVFHCFYVTRKFARFLKHGTRITLSKDLYMKDIIDYFWYTNSQMNYSQHLSWQINSFPKSTIFSKLSNASNVEDGIGSVI